MKLKLALVLCLGLVGGAAIANAAQPHMEAALNQLKAAHQSLESAAADKGGHRANAMKLVAQAMDEVKAGMEFDKTH